MPIRSSAFLKTIGIAVLVVVLAAASAAAIRSRYFEKENGTERAGDALKSVKLIGTDTLELQRETVEVLGVRSDKAEKASQTRPLQLAGSLGQDTNRMAHVHTRFPGEVREIGQVEVQEPDEFGEFRTRPRPVDFGDRVEKDQLLAVLWSKDLGEKKSELVGAIAQRRLHEETLKRLEKYEESVPLRTIREAQLAVEADIIAVEKARRTLRSWMLTEDEITAIEQEADRIWESRGKRAPLPEKDWARVEIRAPFAGTILERNFAKGDIVDTTANLFLVADLSQLRVWANVYEEDLPALQALPLPIPWTVRLKADAGAKEMPGWVDKIGAIVDPIDHTARAMGLVQNKERRMKVGQFITATIQLPPDPGEVQVPAGALYEDGSQSVVFIQPEAGKDVYTQRHVQVARRTRDHVYIRSALKPERKGQKAAPTDARASPLHPGERVVISGAVELKAALDDLLTSKK
jgi:cobalt-zinc-cadmium efflux system membrane fusion protein